MNQEKTPQAVTYTVRGINGHGHYTVWEYLNSSPVNEYKGFDRGRSLSLYPIRRLVPSTVELKKKTVGIQETRREF